MRRDFSFDERSESKVAKSNKTSKNKKGVTYELQQNGAGSSDGFNTESS